jgi:L-aminopeptidase/D-esterase-like protein
MMTGDNGALRSGDAARADGDVPRPDDVMRPGAILTGTQAAIPAGFLLGHAQDATAGTGCTAIICEQGAVGGVAVRGAAPATRETDLLDPRNTVERVNAVVLSGGSAFGLDAAGGVMRWLAERGVGFSTGGFTVPIVCGACLFDLSVGDGKTRPDAAFGYSACENATGLVTVGNVGAGTGASVGKLLGERFAMKSGLGAASVTLGELVVTALVAVNALGNVCDPETGRPLAGVRDPQAPGSILDPTQALLMAFAAGGDENTEAPPAATATDTPPAATTPSAPPTANGDTPNPTPPATGACANTTIGCVLTNGVLTKAQAAHVADMTHDGYARAIEPVHTDFDGDAVFVLSTATVPGSSSLIGMLAASVMEAAIGDAARSATAAYGLPSARDLTKTATEEGSRLA